MGSWIQNREAVEERFGSDEEKEFKQQKKRVSFVFGKDTGGADGSQYVGCFCEFLSHHFYILWNRLSLHSIPAGEGKGV